MWVSLWGKGISELKEFPFIFKFHIGIKTQLMKTSKAHSHGKHYCPTIISEMRYADISTRNRGWKERVPLILRGLVTDNAFLPPLHRHQELLTSCSGQYANHPFCIALSHLLILFPENVIRMHILQVCPLGEGSGYYCFHHCHPQEHYCDGALWGSEMPNNFLKLVGTATLPLTTYLSSCSWWVYICKLANLVVHKQSY